MARTIKYAMIDKSATVTEILALHNCGIEYFLCLFHVLQAWERFVRSADGGVSNKGVRKAILTDINILARTADEATFHITEEQFKAR